MKKLIFYFKGGLFMGFISPDDKWLSYHYQMDNAQLVADFFINTWSVNAICALLGNMSHESSINPCIWEYGYKHSPDRGFGLVQWTPAQKYYDWCCKYGYDPMSGFNQLARIQYEVDNCLQWHPTKLFPISFKEFSQSSKPIEYLTEAFCRCYERPAHPEKSLHQRIDFANACKRELEFSPTIYIVKQGDTLTGIARKFKTTVRTLVRLNNLPDRNKIIAGQQLLTGEIKL
jgi:hypothetical protein